MNFLVIYATALRVVSELINIKKPLQIPQSIIRLQLTSLSGNSTFAADDHASVFVQKLSGDVAARWFSALIETYILKNENN